MRQGNHFHVLIFAPAGLAGIEKFMERCLLPLEPWVSGFKGQTILKAKGLEWMEFDMDPSTTPELHASGEIFLPSLIAFQMRESLSQVLTAADFPHWIGLDCGESGRSLIAHYRHPWPNTSAGA
jgi:hypothetical protein